MSTPVPLRSDFDAAQLHKLARGSRDPDQTRRLLTLAEVYAGGSGSGAARVGGIGLQIVRDWVLRFNAEGPDGLLNGKAPGVPSILDDPAPGVAADRREWPYPSRSWRRALAPYRSGAMGVRGVSRLDLKANSEPGTAEHGLPQALGTPASPCE